MAKKQRPDMSPPMQLLISMLNTSTDELERAILLMKLRSIVESGMVRGVYVVKK